eukprot:TRINITY_DN13368_c0_g1_i1.p1 TRINITY_DN13368_c0_g1~~TRINITY_DN13368_c0_g1_i1.p1  ORF type:complete len:481 (-),score=173.12 TRINITY_DN13368_c0_g1_i1:343-1665(-)
MDMGGRPAPPPEASLSVHTKSERGGSEEEDEEEDEEDEEVGHGLDVASDTSDLKTYVNFIKSYIGSGILAIPFAFKEGGVVLSICMLLGLAIATNYCIRLLLVCAAKYERVSKKRASYSGIGKFAVGRYGVLAVNSSLIFSQVGFCCVYVLFIGHNLESIFPVLPSWAWSLIASPALAIVCFLRSMSMLALISFIGQTAMTAGLGAILVFAFVALATNHPEVHAVNLGGFPIFFGVAVYTFEGIGLVLPMRRAMKKPSHYPYVLDMGYFCVALMVIAFGTIGYLGYGESVSDEITLSLPGGVVSAGVKALLILAIFSTYPVQLFPIIALAEGAVLGRFLASRWIEWYRNAVRTGLVALTVVLALSIPRFSLFVSLVGAIGGSMMAFILPSLFYIAMFRNTAPYLILLSAGSLLVFGLFSSVASISVTLYQVYQVLTGEIE